MVIATGDERALLACVLRARRHDLPLVVPPAADRALPGLPVPDGHLVVYTSGSTTAGRGILRTHRSWSASLDPLTDAIGLLPADRVCVLGSLRSTLSLYGAIHAMHVTGEVILADEPRASATVAHAVPAAAAALLEQPPAGLRMVVVAGDRVPGSLRCLAEDRGVALVEYYGATELSFVAMRRNGSPAGLEAFPGVSVRIVDGVIWASSEYLAVGYAGGDDPAAGGPGRWEDGWATVGDRGHWLGERLIVEGRGDAAVTVGGHTVHLDDVEAYLRAESGNEELALTGIDHPTLGAVVVAVAGGDPAGLPSLRSLARALPEPERPRRWTWVERLPRTPGGKVDRRAVSGIAQGR